MKPTENPSQQTAEDERKEESTATIQERKINEHGAVKPVEEEANSKGKETARVLGVDSHRDLGR